MINMENLSKLIAPKTPRPIKVLQFGEGNFLRAFVDWILQTMNDQGKFHGDVVVVQPMPDGRVKELAMQDGLYTLLLQGVQDGKVVKHHQIIDVLSDFVNPFTDYAKYLEYAHSKTLEFIVSNTTEAGIALDKSDMDFSVTPKSYPGKLLAFLKERYDYFKGDASKGLEILPCELIDDNGKELQRVMNELAVLKGFDARFLAWLNEANHFHSTLVDRIVPGYPRNEIKEIEESLGYHDTCLVKGEIFHLWVIEGDERFQKKFPASDCGLHVIVTENIKPYKERKVKILNGAHTAMVPVAYLMGLDTVRESLEVPLVKQFVDAFWKKEVLPTVHLPAEEVRLFADNVAERFLNPFIRHELMSIALNSTTKYSTRILPIALDFYHVQKKIPHLCVFSLASLAVFYRGYRLNNEIIKLADSQVYLDFWAEAWKSVDSSLASVGHLCDDLLAKEELFGKEFAEIPGLKHELAQDIRDILDIGMEKALRKVLHRYE